VREVRVFANAGDLRGERIHVLRWTTASSSCRPNARVFLVCVEDRPTCSKPSRGMLTAQVRSGFGRRRSTEDTPIYAPVVSWISGDPGAKPKDDESDVDPSTWSLWAEREIWRSARRCENNALGSGHLRRPGLGDLAVLLAGGHPVSGSSPLKMGVGTGSARGRAVAPRGRTGQPRRGCPPRGRPRSTPGREPPAACLLPGHNRRSPTRCRRPRRSPMRWRPHSWPYRRHE